MPGQKRTKAQREMELMTEVRLDAQGVPQWQIAQQLGLSLSMVEKDLALVRNRWRERYTGFLHDEKARVLIKLDELEKTYWDEYKASAGERTVTTETDTGKVDDDGKPIKRISVRRYTNHGGSMEALAGIAQCIQQRRAVLGLDAPTKNALTDTEGNDLVDLENLRQLYFEGQKRLAEGVIDAESRHVDEDDAV